MIKTVFCIVGGIALQIGVFYAGYKTGVKETQRDAYENGLMTIDRVGDSRVYRWIETHKLGYDYDE
jgi:hypothetical protein